MARKRIGATTKRSVDGLQTREIIKGIDKDKEQDKRIAELEKGSKNPEIDKKQDEVISELSLNLQKETEKIKNLYNNLEAESKKVSELYKKVYELNKKNISFDHSNNINKIDINEVKDKAIENKEMNDLQERKINENKSNINRLLDYTEFNNKNFKLIKLKTNLAIIISVIGLMVGIVGLVL